MMQPLSPLSVIDRANELVSETNEIGYVSGIGDLPNLKEKVVLPKCSIYIREGRDTLVSRRSGGTTTFHQERRATFVALYVLPMSTIDYYSLYEVRRLLWPKLCTAEWKPDGATTRLEPGDGRGVSFINKVLIWSDDFTCKYNIRSI